MDPINYGGAFADTPNPAQSFAQGVQLGNGIVQVRAAQEAEAAKAAALRQRQVDLATFSSNPNPTAQDFLRIVTTYPDLKDQLKQGWEQKTAEQQQSSLAMAAPVFAALQAKRYDVANELMDRQGLAMRNSGASQADLDKHAAFSTLLRDHPEYANRVSGLLLASALGPDKFTAAFGGIGGEQRAQDHAPAALRKAEGEADTAVAGATIKQVEADTAADKAATEIRNVKSQIADRAARLTLDQDKFASDVDLKVAELRRKPGAIDLSTSGQKIVDDSVGAATLARQSSAQLTDLASQLETADPSAIGGSAQEWLKKVTGNQGYVTALRSEINRTLTSQAMQAYKASAPGSFSDVDVKTALQGMPNENTPPATMARYLRGVAKIQSYTAQIEDARAEWVGQVGSLAKTARDIDVGGVTVPAGTSFNDFLKKAIKPVGAATQPPGTDARARLFQTYGGH